jgi:hypothetical protein
MLLRGPWSIVEYEINPYSEFFCVYFEASIYYHLMYTQSILHINPTLELIESWHQE